MPGILSTGLSAADHWHPTPDYTLHLNRYTLISMFTGIIQAIGTVARITPNAFGARLAIHAPQWDCKPNEGDSICVNGVCLTYTPQDGGLAFDVIRETLDRSTLGALKAGHRVNLESSLTPATPIGGHFVQGHIDGLGRVIEVYDGADEWRTTVAAEPEVMRYLIPKGSVALDGVSLTVASVDAAAGRFAVALIPTTLKLTTLAERKVGDALNIETDILTRTVVHTLEQMNALGGGLTLDKLRDAGF